MWVITRGNIRVGRVVLSLGTPVPAASTSLEAVAAVWRCSHREPDSRSGMFASGRAETVRQGVLAAAHARSCRIADRETPRASADPRPSTPRSESASPVPASPTASRASQQGSRRHPSGSITGRRLIATAARGGQPLEVRRGLPGFQLSRLHLRPAAVGVPRGRGADPGARHAAARRRHRSGREGRTRGVGMARYCPGAACHSLGIPQDELGLRPPEVEIMMSFRQ